MTKLNVSKARELVSKSLQDTGLCAEYIRYFEDALIETSLKGIDTHGIRLLPLYIKELEGGRANAKPVFEFSQRTAPNMLKMDADGAPGIVAGFSAAEKCIELAKKSGIGVVSVYNSNHFGAASVYGDYIARHNLIGFVTTNAASRVVPYNGTRKLFGTNPLCFTSPTDTEGHYFSLDMATSQVSYSKIKEYLRQNKKLEPGWGVDSAGNAEIEPGKVTSLSPVGGYKGQGLAMVVQLFTSLLTGSLLDHEISHLDEEPFTEGRKISHFFMALDIECFIPLNVFKLRIQEWLQYIRDSPAKNELRVMCPGEPEFKEKALRLVNGIPLSDADRSALQLIAATYNVTID